MQKTRTSKPFRCILMSESKVEPHYFIFLTIITLIVTSFEVYVPRNFNKNFEDNTVRIIRKVFNENWNYRMRSTFYVFLNNYLKVSRFIFPPFQRFSSRFVYTLHEIRWTIFEETNDIFFSGKCSSSLPVSPPKWTSSKDFLTSGYVFLRIVSCRLHPLHSHGPCIAPNPSVPSRQIPFGNEIGGRRVFFGQIVAEP